MKKTVKVVAAAAALTLAFATAACAETVLQLGTTVNEQDSFQVAAEKFAELVEERTNGEYAPLFTRLRASEQKARNSASRR